VNGITLLALLALVIGLPFAYRAGMERGRRTPRNGNDLFREKPMGSPPGSDPTPRDAGVLGPAIVAAVASESAATPGLLAPAGASDRSAEVDSLTAERARLIRSGESEAAMLRREIEGAAAARWQLGAFADDRYRLFREIASARTDVAHYRELLVELEDNTPPPLLDGPNAPDDLKLIVGVGPVLERMLQKLGIGSYRQIAHWSEHDIDSFDARLPEFHGRIRRDGWVIQARALHQSKYGERP
jgi:predicted flap endonuclease-1-like 5' DNA nuclease